MSDEELRRMMLDQFGLRIGDHMTQYVKQMLSGAQQEIAVMGLDARTGVAVRRIIALRSPSEAQPATTASSNFVAR